MAYQSFENLEVWQLARRFAVEVYHALAGCRDYSFRSQITAAACSISNNIAEGSERIRRKEFVQFLSYAKGSAGETRNQLYLAEDLGYITPPDAERLRNAVRLISGKTFALIRSLNVSL
ncbi:MAG TPA: four helix bundle protein [Opitutaceae bacterium]|nr:four helix bundle protein [Opitutaceae bacterium]